MNTDSPETFAGRKALVIGGSGGIGRAAAVALAKKGAVLTIHGGNSRERLENTLDEIRKSGGKAEGFLCPADEPGAAEKILAHSPGPDIVICALGPFERKNLEDTDVFLWEKMAFFNLIFPGTIVSLVIRSMMEKNWGRILLFGGTNTDTIRGYSTTAAYSAAKTALGVVAKSAARTGGSRGVTCNVLCPGLTDTEYLNEKTKTYNREKSPGGIVMKTEEIARAALAILENPGVNGAVIPVDRGIVI